MNTVVTGKHRATPLLLAFVAGNVALQLLAAKLVKDAAALPPALFFPLVMVLAWFYGETITPTNIAGAALVTAGVVLCVLGNPDEAPDP